MLSPIRHGYAAWPVTRVDGGAQADREHPAGPNVLDHVFEQLNHRQRWSAVAQPEIRVEQAYLASVSTGIRDPGERRIRPGETQREVRSQVALTLRQPLEPHAFTH